VATSILGEVLRFVFPSQRLGDRPIGRTPDSESGYPGSSPGLPANSLKSTGYVWLYRYLAF
jgi:hypothetical protein